MSSKGIKFTSLSQFHIWQCSLCKDTKSWKAHREQRQCSRSNSTWRALQMGHGFQSLQIQMFGGMFIIPALRKLGPAWATQWILFQKKQTLLLQRTRLWFPFYVSRGSQTVLTLALRDLMAPSGLHGHWTHVCLHTQRHNYKLQPLEAAEMAQRLRMFSDFPEDLVQWWLTTIWNFKWIPYPLLAIMAPDTQAVHRRAYRRKLKWVFKKKKKTQNNKKQKPSLILKQKGMSCLVHPSPAGQFLRANTLS